MTYIDDKRYKNIVKEIIKNSDFKKMNDIEHHGITRLEHSFKVSYYSYRIALKFDMDYKSVAIGGLLHDFYLDGNERTKIMKFTDTFIHPKKAVVTSTNTFNINNIERDIIISHMFPIYLSIPKYKESILVNLIDKLIGGHEMIKEYNHKFKYRFNYLYLLFIFFINK